MPRFYILCNSLTIHYVTEKSWPTLIHNLKTWHSKFINLPLGRSTPEVLFLLLKSLVRNQVIHVLVLEILICSTPHILQALRKLGPRPVDNQWGIEDQQCLLRCNVPPKELRPHEEQASLFWERKMDPGPRDPGLFEEFGPGADPILHPRAFLQRIEYFDEVYHIYVV